MTQRSAAVPPWSLAVAAMLSVTMSALIFVAIERIPLGTPVAIEFLGPLTVAAVRSHTRQPLVWPGPALVGVVLLTQPWLGKVNPAGVGFAALAAALVGIPQAAGHLTPQTFAVAIGLAILFPVLPFVLELVALRRMTPTAFGTLMALEPAFGVLLGMLLLQQTPAPTQSIGIVLVVVAGAAAQRRGRRSPTVEAAGPHSELDLIG
jgi:inner membrane transporter RhtA